MTTKPELQEQALQLEISIYYPEGHEKAGKELNKEELTEAVATARTAALAAHEAEEVAKEEARQPLPEEPEEPEADDEPVAPVKASKSRKGGRKLEATPLVRDPPAPILLKNGVTVCDADRKMAKKHGYPVAIPGGRPYKTAVSINCIFGGGLRPLGSTVILDDVEADRKADYLTAL